MDLVTAAPQTSSTQPDRAAIRRRRGDLRQAVWEMSQTMPLPEIREFVDGVLDEIARDEH